MKLCFQLSYRTLFGEFICILGKAPGIVEWDEEHPLKLHCLGEDFWTTEIELSDFADTLQYRYAVLKTDGSFIYESGEDRQIKLITADQKYTIKDFWQPASFEKVFYSTAFTKSIFARGETDNDFRRRIANKDTRTTHKTSFAGNLLFSLSIPQVAPQQGLAILGNIPELGNWDVRQKVIMDDSDFPLWKTAIRINDDSRDIEYKYLLYDLNTGAIIDFEDGENRRICFHTADNLLICSDICFRRSQGNWRGAGVAIPVFSLRSRDSFGIGEFSDLKKMVDWAVQTGQKIIQTLPVNDTTIHHNSRDSYPYNAVSVFALNPNYLNIDKIARFLAPETQKEYLRQKAEFNALSYVDYQKVAEAKMRYLKILYRQEKDRVFVSEDYRLFFERNREWLVPYAVFCYLRDRFGTAYFHSWEQYSVYHTEDILRLCDPQAEDYNKVALHYFIQYHADKQLHEVRAYAHRAGIALKGDIPIGISPDSVEAWTSPELFHLDMRTGAPPDDFSVSGQNWGFPTYDWENMAKDGYQWWAKRFRKMADYFDAYRIDHILGFFRIWEIPQQDVWGLCGRFSPALPYSMEELREKGIDLNAERLLQPYIRAAFLPEMFGEEVDYVKAVFLETGDNDTFHFRPAFDTQRKIEDFFEAKQLNEPRHQAIKKGLFLLLSEVLFLPDLRDSQRMHPRVGLYNTHSFKDLDTDMQHKMSQIHEDFFYHRHNDFWKASAMRKLPSLTASTGMLACGEDLGMVPACVPEVMKELSILSLEIQRMPKAPTEFGDPAQAPYLSVCTTSTHDTNPLRAWWEEDKEKTQRYYNGMLHLNGKAPACCTEDIIRDIVARHLQSPAMWVILPFQDWTAIDKRVALPDCHAERINVPDDPHNFWSYRIHLSLEELLQKEDFNRQIRQMIHTCGR